MQQLGLVGAVVLALTAVYLVRMQLDRRRRQVSRSGRAWFWAALAAAGAVTIGAGGLAAIVPTSSLVEIVLRDVAGPSLAAVVLAVLGTHDHGPDAGEALRRLGD